MTACSNALRMFYKERAISTRSGPPTRAGGVVQHACQYTVASGILA